MEGRKERSQKQIDTIHKDCLCLSFLSFSFILKKVFFLKALCVAGVYCYTIWIVLMLNPKGFIWLFPTWEAFHLEIFDFGVSFFRRIPKFRFLIFRYAHPDSRNFFFGTLVFQGTETRSLFTRWV